MLLKLPAERLAQLVERHRRLIDELGRPDLSPQRLVQLSREQAELEPVAEAARRLDALVREAAELRALGQGADRELAALAESELETVGEALAAQEEALARLLLPRDPADQRPVVLEIRAGTGGEEAALFAADLWRMYQRFAALRGWTVELLSVSAADGGGVKELSAAIAGRDVYGALKFESGVHRVQRVPVTEASGRIHTSAATVAVLPEPEEVDVVLDERELRIDVFRASGPGGQSVNTTDSAVRIVHLPTGLTVIQQDEKSQHKNKARAMKVLRARLYDLERSRMDAERARDRAAQVGSGDRSERIRTYNFREGRVTDHRINLTLHRLDEILSGEGLGDLVDALARADEARRLAELDEA